MPGHSAHLALSLPGLGSSHTAIRYYVFRKNIKMQERGERSSCHCRPPRSTASRTLGGEGHCDLLDGRLSASLCPGLVRVWASYSPPSPAPTG